MASLWTPRRADTPAAFEKPSCFRSSSCRLACAIICLAVSIVSLALYKAFTPVYVPPTCWGADSGITRLEVGPPVGFGMRIQVTCENRNNYGVEVLRAQPGRVWIDAGHEWTLMGGLALLEGYKLLPRSTGTFNLTLDADLPQDVSEVLMPHLVNDEFNPLYLELRFGVDVNLPVLLGHDGMLFEKNCGLTLAGVLQGVGERLSPLYCRDTRDEVQHIIQGLRPHKTTDEPMTFTGAQMDLERLANGERTKTVVFLGGALAFAGLGVGIFLFAGAIANVKEQDARPVALLGSHLNTAMVQPNCMRGYSGNVAEADAATKMLGLAPFGSPREPAPSEGVSGCLKLMNVLSCGVVGRNSRARNESELVMAPRQPSCMRATSGNLPEARQAQYAYMQGQPSCLRATSGNGLEADVTQVRSFGWGG